ncbi:MAG TPA: B12-binding domain-containing protein [Anaerolineae bacterium]|nr:B12-binding domain-containing protein [Anaerolineae bacterium]
MSRYNRTPIFNLQLVVHQTGLAPDTLRAWEKRYNLPQPDRTSGGHRLYSEYDIEMLKWLVARKEEGMSIGRAVALWRQLEAEGRDPLEASLNPPQQPSTATPLATGQAVAQVRQKWIAACLAFNEETAENELAQAFALYPPDTVCLEVLQNGLAEIGELWHRGQATVQQEHFASALAMRRLQAIVAALPRPTRTELILVGCPPEEEHSFGALLLTLLLRRQGWRVTYLGANVPLNKLSETLATVKPRLVVMPAQRLRAAATLLEVASFLKGGHIPLAFGGNIFNQIPALPARIPGHFLGATLPGAVQKIDHLLTTRLPLPPAIETPAACGRALEHYQTRQALIEVDLYFSPFAKELPPVQLIAANRELAGNIVAALTLGDIHFADAEITWLETLLDNHQIPTLRLSRYLTAYQQAASANLAEAGAPIITWLERWTKPQEIK